MTYMNSNLVEPHIYTPDTLISINTNKPLPDGEQSLRKLPIFWCEACGLRVATPTQAIQHLSGRSHKVKVKNSGGDIPEVDDVTRKRVLDSTTTNSAVEPVPPKKIKVESAEVFDCKVCNLVCNSALMREQHIKGKKHASTLARLAAPPKPLVAPSLRPQFNYYCIPCKVRVKGSEVQVKQHYDNAEHKMNAGLEPAVTVDQVLAGSVGVGKVSEFGGMFRGGAYGGRGSVQGGRGSVQGGRGSVRGGRGGVQGGRGSVRGGRGYPRGGRGSGGERGGLMRGSFRGNFSDKGRGWERGSWGASRGHPRGRAPSRGGGVPVGGQYGSDPPFDATSPNFQQVGENVNMPRGNDYTPRGNDNFIKAEPGSSDNYHGYSHSDKHASTDSFYSNTENYYYDNSQQQSSSNGHFDSTSGPTYSSEPPSNYYSSQPLPSVSKHFTADNGNYYSNGYNNTDYPSDSYGNKQNNYDSFYQ